MFTQVLRAKVKDAAAATAAGERWQTDLKPGATGYLGSTTGITDDGTFIVVVRFASEADARANSERPEQTAWTAENSGNFDGEITFYDCPDVDVMGQGGSDAAGFVQLMIYKPKNVAATRALAAQDEKLIAIRSDLIGAATAYATDGTVIQTNYFTSEDAAREGEKEEIPAELASFMGEFQDNAGEIEFIDLREPQLHSA